VYVRGGAQAAPHLLLSIYPSLFTPSAWKVNSQKFSLREMVTWQMRATLRYATNLAREGRDATESESSLSWGILIREAIKLPTPYSFSISEMPRLFTGVRGR